MISPKIEYDVFLKGDHVNLVALTEEMVEKSNWHNWFNIRFPDEQIEQLINIELIEFSINELDK